MVRDLFVHVCIVITFLFLGGSIFRYTPYLHTLRQKLFFGTLSGILGSLLMLFSIHLTSSVIMDYRHIAILFSALYGGPAAAAVTVIIIIFSRIVFIGGDLLPIVVSSVNMIFITVFSSLISKSNLSEMKKWIYMYLFSLVVLTGGFEILLGLTKQFYDLLLEYWTVSIGAGGLLFYCVNYIVQFNRSFYNAKKQSSTDFLTGLNNLRQFQLALAESAEKARKHGEKLSFLMIDIDNFKKINDTYGHETGNEVLRQTGAILSFCSRSFDIPSRMGGDEFSVLLLNCTNPQALEIGERIRTQIEKHEYKTSEGKLLRFTVSIGVSTYLETTQQPERLLKQADIALYKAKNAGKNKVFSVLSH